MNKKQGCIILVIGLALSGCGHVAYDFTPYNASYNDTEMPYGRGYYIEQDPGTTDSTAPRIEVSTGLKEVRPAMPPLQYNEVSTSIEEVDPATPTSQHATEVQVVQPQRDNAWVQQQSSNAYTIELVDDMNSSEVASRLMQAPKREHSAEYLYMKKGIPRYKGLYGSFATYQDADVALKSLPDSLRAEAKIKQFGAL